MEQHQGKGTRLHPSHWTEQSSSWMEKMYRLVPSLFQRRTKMRQKKLEQPWMNA